MLSKIFKTTKKEQLSLFVPHLNVYLPQYAIDTKLRIAHFLGQTGHESAEYKTYTENLNYSAEALARCWPSKYAVDGKVGGKPNDLALKIAHKPEAIANNIYSNRMGNGPESSGDGWKYKGVGLIQTTGKNNLSLLAKRLNMPIDDALKFAATPEGAVKSACIFWVNNNLSNYADRNDLVALTKVINGGTNGLDDRKRLTEAALSILP